jgi:polysaccharide biosynthesis PFTS motif protein
MLNSHLQIRLLLFDSLKPLFRDKNLVEFASRKLSAILFSDLQERKISVGMSVDSNQSNFLKGSDGRGALVTLSSSYLSIELSLVRKIKEIFLVVLLLTLFSVTLFWGKNKYIDRKTFNIVFGLSKHQSMTKKQLHRLQASLDEERFNFGSNVDFYLIERRHKFSVFHLNSNRVQVTMVPSLFLFKNYLSRREKLKVLVKMYFTALQYLDFSKANNLRVLLWKEIVFENTLMYYYSDLFPIRNLILTNNNIFVQPFLFLALEASAEKSMIWYSNNNKPIRPLGGLKNHFDETIYKDIPVEVHYVWTESDRDFLQGYNLNSQFRVIGSIMLYDLSGSHNKKQNTEFSICIFDVSPKKGAWYQLFFYSEERVIEFLESSFKTIVSLRKDLNADIGIYLKPKRATSKKEHPKTYLRYLLQCQSDFGVQLIDPKDDIYSLISQMNFIVCIPFTSPAVIAQELGVPVCYYSSSPEFDLLDSLDGIPVHKSIQQLRIHIESELVTYLRTGFLR